MIKYLLIFLLPISVYATKILSYNIYDRTDRVDLMITFDTPYNGVIKQSKHKSKIIIKLENAEIETSKIKKLSTKFLDSITITPMQNYTQVVATIPSNVHLIAAKTTDAYGLRLRFTNSKNLKKSNIHKLNSNNKENLLPTKNNDTVSNSYYIVVGILIIGILILFLLQKKIEKSSKNRENSSWLFKENNKIEQKMHSNNMKTDSTSELSIRFQRNIDETNSVAMIDFGNQSYLVLIGKNNLLLDKYIDNKPTTEEDFDTILKSRHQELDDFLKVENKESKEALQAYKERAASIIYTEEN